MTENEKQIKENLENLRNELEKLISFFEQGLDFSIMVYDLWSAKDILGLITFWHESFARNISDLAKSKIPNPLKGKLSEVNKLSVETTKNVSITLLIQRIRLAQRTIEEFIFLEHITSIPYKKGFRDYSRNEHLEIVAKHIHKHVTDLNKRYGTPK